MADSNLFELFNQRYVDKQIEIEYDGGTITNEELFSESLELTESLCSESELRFGACEPSQIKFKIANVFVSLYGKWIRVRMYLNGNKNNYFMIGKYKIYSDVPTADRKWRDIVAYDVMYDILNSDVANWYNGLKFPINLNTFRNLFFMHLDIDWNAEDGSLINDNIKIQKTIKPSELSGKDVITAICEINGCFGHIGRNGKFEFIYLEQEIGGIYPSNKLFPATPQEHFLQSKTGNLYPQNPKSKNIAKNGTYISAKYEDFITNTINQIQIRNNENDIGKVFPEGEIKNRNSYIIENNFLVYGMSDAELSVVAENILNKISNIKYRPFTSEIKGNPCLEVGESIRISTKHELIESYILKRTLKGIQALRDIIESQGVEKYSQKLNGSQKSIMQLKGKTNELIRTVEETKSTITDVEEDLQSQITQTANRIDLKVSKGDVSSEISLEEGEVSIKGNRLVVESDNFKLDRNGNVEFSGGIISGGEIYGSQITAKDGMSLQYEIPTLPPIEKSYVFAKTGYDNPSEGGLANEPFLNILTPKGNAAIIMGSGLYEKRPEEFKEKDTPYFPNGAHIEYGYLGSVMKKSFFFENTHIEGENYIHLTARTSGVLIYISGAYYCRKISSGETENFSVTVKENNFFPENTTVRTIGNYGERVFVFSLRPEGKISIKNTGDDLESSDYVQINFRFDFFKF